MFVSIEAAVHTFSLCRPPGIYKGSYIIELFRRYDDEANAPPSPEDPDWCNEDEDTALLDDDGNSLEDVGPSSRKKRRVEQVKANPTFMTGVSGATPVQDPTLLSSIQHRVQDMCNWPK